MFVTVCHAGTMEQRWSQLEESYAFTARYSAQTKHFRATRMRREADGGLTHVVSWPSLGGSEAGSDDEDVSEPEVYPMGADADAAVLGLANGKRKGGVGAAVAAGVAKARRRAGLGEEVTYRLVEAPLQGAASNDSIIGEEGLAFEK